MSFREEPVSKKPEMLSSEEVIHFRHVLDPLLSDFFLGVQKSIADESFVEDIHELAPQHTADMSDRQVRALVPIAFAQYMNPLTGKDAHDMCTVVLEQKGMAREEAGDYISQISGIVSARTLGEFRALGKALHAEHLAEEAEGRDSEEEKMLSQSELSELSIELEPLWNEYFFELQMALVDTDTIARIRERSSGRISNMSDEQVLDVLPDALAAYFNPLSDKRIRDAYSKDLQRKGVEENDAERSVAKISAVVNADMLSRFESWNLKEIYRDAHGLQGGE